MYGDLFNGLNLWLLFCLGILVLFLASETGLYLGRRFQERMDQATRVHITTVEAALLGLLALLLGFAFVMAVGRYERRRDLLIEEANAIGTAYLRTELLQEPHDQISAQLFREYLNARLDYYRAGENSEKLRDSTSRAELILRRLWKEAIAAAKVNSDEVRTGYYIEALNGVIDDQAKRSANMEAHVPEIVFWLLYFVALLTLGLVGFCCSFGIGRHLVIRAILTLITVATIQVIVDLDRPRSGYIVISEKHLLDLREVMSPSASS